MLIRFFEFQIELLIMRLRYAVPLQLVDLENEKKLKLANNYVANNSVRKNKHELFKPPNNIWNLNKHYYFNSFTGSHNQNMNYRCRDHTRCKASIKVSTSDPLRGWDFLKDHSPTWRSHLNSWLYFYRERSYFRIDEI